MTTAVRQGCPTCGAEVSGGAFCAMCGSRLEARPAPADGRPDAIPAFRIERARRRLLGVPVAVVLALVAVAGFVAALVLLATGAWPLGVVLLVVATACAAALLWAAERGATTAAYGPRPLERARARARLPVVSALAWTRAGRALLPLRKELRVRAAERWARVHELGEAALREDEAAVAALRGRIRGIDRELEELQRRAAGVVEALQQHVDRERLAVQPTVAKQEPPPPASQ